MPFLSSGAYASANDPHLRTKGLLVAHQLEEPLAATAPLAQVAQGALSGQCTCILLDGLTRAAYQLYMLNPVSI